MGDSADMCDGKFPFMAMGDLGVRTPIGVSGNYISNSRAWPNLDFKLCGGGGDIKTKGFVG